MSLDPRPEKSIALVLAAHGDRGGAVYNDGLEAHVAALAAMNRFACVAGGVLNGTPSLEDALARAEQSGADWILVYPLFMSDGYFAGEVLPDRVGAAKLRVLTSILQPLGQDSRAALLMLESALRAAKSAGLDPGQARLLVVGHGSKNGTANAESTRRAARGLAPHSPFARIETAFLEEAPFVAEALSHYSGKSVVAGFFSSEGMHAGLDIPAAIRHSGAAAVYAGAIGLHSRIPELIVSSVHRALEEPDTGAGTEPERGPAAPAGAPMPPHAAADNRPKAGPQAHDSPSRRTAGGGTSPIRFLFKAVFTLALMAALALGAIAFLVPEDVVRDQVASLVKQQTGRDLTVRGKTSFSMFPNVGVELEDVSISNPPGMKSGEMLRMGSLNLNLKLLPLVSRRVEVERFVLVRPVFNLIVDKKGRRNWDFSKKTAALAPASGDETQAGAAVARTRAMIQAQAGGPGGAMVQDISFGTAKIIDGVVKYTDETTGTKQRVDALNVSIVQPALSEPLDAEGSLVWRDEEVTFKGRLASAPALLRNASSKAKVAISTARGKADFDGKIAFAGGLSANGAVAGETSSLRALASWLGTPIAPGGGLGAAAISGRLGLENDTVAFTKAKLSLDGMNGQGQASIRLKGVRPYIKATLALDKLDLNPYLTGASAGAAQPKASNASKEGPAPQPKAKQSLTDFIDQLNEADEGSGKVQPQVRAWSQRAMDITGLRAVDADVNVTAGALYYRKIKVGKSAVTASLKSGLLTADLTRLALYSGTGTGRVTVNGARAVPGIAAQFDLQNISALPLLRDAVDFKWISGRADMTISLSGTGRSQSELVRSLQGNAKLVFSNGAIEGINIPAMVRGLKQGKFGGWKRREREKTDFSRFSGSFVVQKGIAYNKDLNLVGPLIRMTGEGNIDLGRERIDYAALPRLVASLQGQGAADDRKGIAVPVRITGPWAKPKVVPDLKRLLEDPELAKETADKVGKVLKKLKNKKDVKKLLDGLLGGGDQGAGDGTQPQGEKVNPEDVLRKLFQ